MTDRSNEITEEEFEANYWSRVDEYHARETLDDHCKDQQIPERTEINSCVVCNAAFHVFEEEKNENMVCGHECLDEYRTAQEMFIVAKGEGDE